MADLSEIVKKEYVEGDNTLCFETTPIWKIVFLSLITIGLYDFILLYRYWKTLKENFGYKVNSFVRGFIFGVFFNFKLFKIFKKYMNGFGVETVSSTFLAVVFFILAGVDEIADGIQYMNNDMYSTTIALLNAISIFTFTVIIYYQRRINKINKQFYPSAKVNKWSLENTLWALPFTFIAILFYGNELIEVLKLTK